MSKVDNMIKRMFASIILVFMGLIFLFCLTSNGVINLTNKLHFQIFIGAIGYVYMTMGLTMFLINYSKKGDDVFVSVPYAGKQKVSPKLAKVINGFFFILGIGLMITALVM